MSVRQVFFNIDHRGVVPVSVAIYSLLKSADPEKPLAIHIAHDTKFAEIGGCGKIESVVRRFPFASVRFANFDPIFERHRAILDLGYNHWSYLVWAWVFCTELFPDLTGNLVFIDWDMYILKDLEEMYALDLSTRGFVAAAVNESRREHRRYLVEAGWPDAAGYSFNNATTVLDLDAFRRERMSDKMIDWYRRNFRTAVNLDQDAQNVAYGDRTLRLHPKWNYTDGWLERLLKLNPFAREWRVHPPREILEAILEPAIIHYIGRKKPTSWNHRPERKVYRRAMSELGLLENGRLPGETPARKAVAVLFDGYHGLLKLYARLLLALISPKAPSPMRRASSTC